MLLRQVEAFTKMGNGRWSAASLRWTAFGNVVCCGGRGGVRSCAARHISEPIE